MEEGNNANNTNNANMSSNSTPLNPAEAAAQALTAASDTADGTSAGGSTGAGGGIGGNAAGGSDCGRMGGNGSGRKKWLISAGAAAAVVVVGGGLFAYHKLHTGDKNDDQTYLESTAEQQDIQLTLSATGTVEPANQYDVTAAVQGDVVSCTFEEGDMVQKGDTLYLLEETEDVGDWTKVRTADGFIGYIRNKDL